MPVKAGPKDDNVSSLIFAYNMADLSQSYDGYPVQNFVSATYTLYRYNNPGFSGYTTNTGRVHPVTNTPIWELSFYPQNESMVPRLTSTEGFGCYHSMGASLYAGKIYMASIMIKEGAGTEIFNNYIHHGYSNIGGWNSNGTTNTREYVGDGWWRFYTLWNNQTTAYSADGVTPLATRYMSNYYTTYDLPAGESIVQSTAMNFAQYVGNTPYRGTYGIYPSVQDDYDGVGVTILDWGIDEGMTKPTYNPVFNYPDPNFSRTIWYRINMGAAGRCRIRTYTYGVSIYLTDSKYWKITFRDTVLNQHKVAYFTAPMIHEVPSIDYKKPWIYVNGTRSGGLKNIPTGQEFDLSSISKNAIESGFYFDGTNDSIAIGNVGGYSTNITCEAVFKTASSATWKNIVSGSCADIIFTVNGNKLNFGCQCNGPIPHANYSTSIVNDDQWYHGVATYNGSEVKIYINGVLESTNARSGSITPSALRVGSNNAGSSEFFDGQIPLLKMYNKALTAEEVQNNYNAIKSRYNIS